MKSLSGKHIIPLANEGALDPASPHALTADDIAQLITGELPAAMLGWDKPRVLLYAHGGVVDAVSATQYALNNIDRYLSAHIFPLFFVWRSSPMDALQFAIQDVLRTTTKKPKGLLDEEVDAFVETIARAPVKPLWSEMKENALAATTNANGGARLIANQLAVLKQALPALEIHLAGHSAGGIFHGPLSQFIVSDAVTAGPLAGQRGLGLEIASCSLWAPGCTHALFKQTYAPALQSGRIKRFSVYTLSDQAERGDITAGIYHKSVLYLVSNALESRLARLFGFAGEPLLGLQKFQSRDAEIQSLVGEWVLAGEHPEICAATSHGGFDDDSATINSTIKRILG